MSTLVLGGATIAFMASRTRSKSLSDAENERLRDVIRKHVLPRYQGSQSLAGPALGMTQAGLSRILAGGGASLATAHAVSRVLGTTVADVLGWPVAEVVPASPRFGDLPAWRLAETEARRLYGDVLPSFAFDRAANTKGGAVPAVIDARTVFQLAKFWFDTASQEERIAAEREEILAKKAEEDATTSSRVTLKQLCSRCTGSSPTSCRGGGMPPGSPRRSILWKTTPGWCGASTEPPGALGSATPGWSPTSWES